MSLKRFTVKISHDLIIQYNTMIGQRYTFKQTESMTHNIYNYTRILQLTTNISTNQVLHKKLHKINSG